MARRLSKATEDEIVALWEAGCRVMREIAREVDVYPLTVRRVLDRRGVEVNGHLEGGKEKYVSPEEVRERTMEVRRGWSKATRRRRRVTKPVPYEIPEAHGVGDDGTQNGSAQEED